MSPSTLPHNAIYDDSTMSFAPQGPSSVLSWNLLIGCVVTLFIPIVFALSLPTHSPTIYGLSEVLYAVAAAVYLWRRPTVQPLQRLMALALFLLAVADGIYACIILRLDREALWATFFSEVTYTVVFGLLLLHSSLTILRQSGAKKMWTRLIGACASLVYLGLSIQHVVMPYLLRQPLPPLFMRVDCVLLTFLQTALIYVVVPRLLTTRSFRVLNHLASLVLLCLSDFALRHELMSVIPGSGIIFEAAWYLAVGTLALNILVHCGLPDFDHDDVGFGSFRFCMTLGVFGSVALFAGEGFF